MSEATHVDEFGHPCGRFTPAYASLKGRLASLRRAAGDLEDDIEFARNWGSHPFTEPEINALEAGLEELGRFTETLDYSMESIKAAEDWP